MFKGCTGGLSFGKSMKPLWSHTWRTSPDGLWVLMHGVLIYGYMHAQVWLFRFTDEHQYNHYT